MPYGGRCQAPCRLGPLPKQLRNDNAQGERVRLLPKQYADACAISIYHISPALMRVKSRAIVDVIVKTPLFPSLAGAQHQGSLTPRITLAAGAAACREEAVAESPAVAAEFPSSGDC